MRPRHTDLKSETNQGISDIRADLVSIVRTASVSAVSGGGA
jgi:hypothetical protein